MDKQDQLAVVVCQARLGVALPSPAEIEPSDDDLRIAAAVRSFMGSPEAVERLALFNVAAEIDDPSLLTHGWGEYPYADEARDFARAALSAAIGEGLHDRQSGD